ncbi:MAG: helix-turn-helix domain-containing protein [Kiritimatiellia bacterium]
MSFGETLRAAREARGLTCSEVAKQTRLLVQIVEEMEQEDFHRIAAPIYGRGFVRLYATCVGLDPTPLVAEFMEIYEGRRAPIVRTRAVPAAQPPPSPPPAEMPGDFGDGLPPAEPPPPPPPPPPAFEPAAAADGTESAADGTDFAVPPADEPPECVAEPPDAESVPAPEPPAAPEPPPALRGLDLFEQAYASRQEPAPEAVSPLARNLESSPFLPPSYEKEEGPTAGERFKQGLSEVSRGIVTTVKRIPRSTWRFSLLGVSAVAVVLLVSFACVKLYRLTTPPAAPEPAPPEGVRPPAADPANPDRTPHGTPVAPPHAPRPPAPAGLRATGQKIPPLYVD